MFFKAFKIAIKKRSGTRSGTLHIYGSTPLNGLLENLQNTEK